MRVNDGVGQPFGNDSGFIMAGIVHHDHLIDHPLRHYFVKSLAQSLCRYLNEDRND